MTKVLQKVTQTLRTKDIEGRGKGLPSQFWIIEDIDEFVQEFRTQASELAKVPWATYDFTTMYEALEHDKLVGGIMRAISEAWAFERAGTAAQSGRATEEVELCLGPAGWEEAQKVQCCPGSLWFTQDSLHHTLRFMLMHLFVENGGVVRRQERGVPMGLECSPQLANLYGYAVESAWIDSRRVSNLLSRRFIDDIYVAGPMAMVPGEGLPLEEDYAMKYKRTSESPDSLIYLGVRLFKDERGAAHTVLHDRAVDYPFQIDRYPEVSTVANPSQLGGVIMGRLVAAQRTCSRLDLFQDAVAGIFTHAHWRGYSRRLLHSTWSRFLVR